MGGEGTKSTARRVLGVAALLAAAACGGAAESSGGPATTPSESSESHVHPVRAFHDLLDPFWRMERSDARAHGVCDRIASIQGRAAAIREDYPDRAAGEAVAEAVLELTNTVDTLQLECEAMATHDHRASPEDVNEVLDALRATYDRLSAALRAR